MRMKRRILSVLLLFLCSATTVFAAEPDISARGAALIDGETGRLLWGRNAEEPLAMASTTKIMTAVLVLENCDLEEIVTVSKTAACQPEVHMDLKEGEQWKAGDLLSAMMLRSYNDAAAALAEHVSGSVAAFCDEMTKKAKETAFIRIKKTMTKKMYFLYYENHKDEMTKHEFETNLERSY